jgi:AraC-like DNA-binding protein
VLPGEVEHEIDLTQLYSPPKQALDSVTQAACESIYRLYVEPQRGNLIPDAAFCDLDRAVFLDYLVERHNIQLSGSNQPDLTQLEPMVLSRNLIGWHVPRYVAFRSSIEAIYFAIVDVERLKQLGRSTKTTLALPGSADSPSMFYYALDYRVASEAPWRHGTVYLYKSEDFTQDEDCGYPIRPIARLNVTPKDWPMLDKVYGVDSDVQVERQWDTFLGYPWCEDDEVHPGRWKRSVAEEARAYLEANFSEPTTLTQLGQAIGCSPFATLRLFRFAMGQSPREYQTQIRISKAKEFLKRGDPIAAVAADTGFCDQTHLTRHFRHHLGLTPGQYLRLQESPIHLG